MNDRRAGGSAGYAALHAVYDRWQASYGIDYSRRIFPRLLRLLSRYEVPTSTAVDLGCGTGTLALLLEHEGWRVIGVDASAGMVARAEEKAAKAGASARFQVGDLRSFTIPEPVQLAVSLYDVVNHLPSVEDLLLACRAVRAALRPGGTFIFDLNNDRCFNRLWTRDETITLPEFTMTLVNTYDRESRRAFSRVHVTFADGREDVEEIVEERCFLRPEVEEALRQAGFTLLQFEDFPFPGAPWAGKLKTWVVAGVP